MLNEFLFTKIKEEDIGNIWFQKDGAKCHTAEATLDVLSPVFDDCIIKRRATSATSELQFDTVGLLFVGWRQRQLLRLQARHNDALKDNIREAIGELQLYTIDNVLKN